MGQSSKIYKRERMSIARPNILSFGKMGTQIAYEIVGYLLRLYGRNGLTNTTDRRTKRDGQSKNLVYTGYLHLKIILMNK